jgi:hypothetical protein
MSPLPGAYGMNSRGYGHFLDVVTNVLPPTKHKRRKYTVESTIVAIYCVLRQFRRVHQCALCIAFFFTNARNVVYSADFGGHQRRVAEPVHRSVRSKTVLRTGGGRPTFYTGLWSPYGSTTVYEDNRAGKRFETTVPLRSKAKSNQAAQKDNSGNAAACWGYELQWTSSHKLPALVFLVVLLSI